ncbi:MAG TPA: thioredoxin family protein [Thermoanaerobaculia bacterium]|nr:thioredoxin family protein [Thermoanaerobaculia bacterium]
MTHSRTVSGALLALLIAAASAVAAPPAKPAPAKPAAPMAIDNVLNGFTRTGEYLLMVNGKPVPAAEIYRNERLPAYLIVTAAFPNPVLLMAGSMDVETVAAAKLVRQPDGSMAVAADADTRPQGKFKLQGDKVAFASEGRTATLGSNPPLLGTHRSPDLKNHSPEYMVGARNYTPKPAVIAALKKEKKPVKVKVFFGSWCPHCKQHLPYMLRVEDEIRGSGTSIQFEYYGLPKGFSNEPEAKKYNVDGVPLAIVFVNGREAGRISGGGWESPETTLSNILAGKPVPSR